MSRLALFGRPFVVFDASDKNHRAYYHNFVVTGSWGTCPFRFVVDDDHGDLITMIQRNLIKYYSNKEFGAVVKEQQPKIRPKQAKTVDTKPKRRYN
jgi:hypothetical protein